MGNFKRYLPVVFLSYKILRPARFKILKILLDHLQISNFFKLLNLVSVAYRKIIFAGSLARGCPSHHQGAGAESCGRLCETTGPGGYPPVGATRVIGAGAGQRFKHTSATARTIKR